MDEMVRKAMAKWPQVPALFGWLGLDRRGRWLLQGKPIEREPLIAFMNRNYAADEFGRWFFQNGPQRAYVHLEYTPWVLRATGSGELETHTGASVPALESAWLDEHGSILLAAPQGVALLDDNDLGWAYERLVDADGNRPGEAVLAQALERLQELQPAELFLSYGGRRLPIQPLRSGEAAQRFGFEPQPAPREGERSS
jgi:hypothetical protein